MHGGSINRAFGHGYQSNYDGEGCNAQIPSFMSSNNPETISSTTNGLANPISPKNWDAFSNAERPQSIPSIPCSNQASPRSTAFSGGSLNGSTAELAADSSEMSLPSNAASVPSVSGSGRILPDPVMARRQQSNLLVAGGPSAQEIPTQNSGHRNSTPWFAGDSVTVSAASADRGLSAACSPMFDTNGGTDEPVSTSNGSFTYLPVSHSPFPSSTNNAPASTNSASIGLYRQDCDISGENRLVKISQDNRPSAESALGDTYGYSSEYMANRRSTSGSIPSGSLSNGQEYLRLRSPAPTAQELYNGAGSSQNRFGPHTRLPHRTSIASLNHLARY